MAYIYYTAIIITSLLKVKWKLSSNAVMYISKYTSKFMDFVETRLVLPYFI